MKSNQEAQAAQLDAGADSRRASRFREPWVIRCSVASSVPRVGRLCLSSAFVARASPHLLACRPTAFYPSSFLLCRFVYTGGYVLPGTTPDPAQTQLPDDLENAAVEQVAFWFQKREQLGIRISWPSGGTYQQFAVQDLLPAVQSVLASYTRWSF